MPSRLGVTLIALFWVATTGFVVYRDVLPHYISAGPPPIRIEMTDEATAQIPAKWSLYWDQGEGMKKVGGASTDLSYEPSDDTFWFNSEYRDVKFEVLGFLVELANVQSDVRVTRAGALREQRFVGDVKLSKAVLGNLGPKLTLADATAQVAGRVQDKTLTGRCRVWTPVLTRTDDRWHPTAPAVVDEPLEPVPVPDGQALNPMMPLAKLRGVKPGKTWVIRVMNPLAESIAATLRNATKKADMNLLAGLTGRPGATGECIARVRSSPEELVPVPPPGAEARPKVPCFVIDYTGDEGMRAVTWVGVADGTVYRQEATLFGETMRFERDY